MHFGEVSALGIEVEKWRLSPDPRFNAGSNGNTEKQSISTIHFPLMSQLSLICVSMSVSLLFGQGGSRSYLNSVHKNTAHCVDELSKAMFHISRRKIIKRLFEIPWVEKQLNRVSSEMRHYETRIWIVINLYDVGARMLELRNVFSDIQVTY